MIIKKWHIYVVDLEPRIGTKPGKQRPCLSVQPTELAQCGIKSTVILPLTTNVLEDEAFPLRVKVKKGICNLGKESELLVDQILAWDNSLFKKDLGEIPEYLQEKVQLALKDFFEI